ncbi:hypothetical protein RND71_033360 [Anisodus tanguticus]|uniref:THH1/TOM1/TOM3 domain-containing protein n=1 Tax=Anisodus tanguticus TaxID=243964 RepID=A0AAE1V1D3_9SOLA|nr:hypothetical protein RND71_033360 [Anisodus tanguticus]
MITSPCTATLVQSLTLSTFNTNSFSRTFQIGAWKERIIIFAGDFNSFDNGKFEIGEEEAEDDDTEPSSPVSDLEESEPEKSEGHSQFFWDDDEGKLQEDKWGLPGIGEMTRLPLGSAPIDIAGPATNWWDEVNESVQWQDGIFYSLCASYALVSAVALIQLIRIELRVPEYGWTTQKVFHLMNFVVNGVRATVFGFHKQAFLFHHKARSLPTDKLRISYISINGVIYFIQACIWVYIWHNDNSTMEFIGKIFVAVVSFIAALGFLLYGGRLFLMLRRFPIESKGRRKKLHEVGSVTAICFTCFLIRCFVVVLSAFDADASLDVLDHPVLNLIYYLLVEILPSALVLYILRKLPPKRVSAQYHPIS